VQQLAEVALHALSPGINEPFTAGTCIDRLGQGLARLARRATPSGRRADAAGRLRVVTQPLTFTDLVAAAFDPIRQHAAREPLVAVHVLDVLARIARQAARPSDREAIARQGRLMTEAAARTLAAAEDVRAVEAAAARLDHALTAG
jgi:uncharacterized membrane protein